jgi:hypothetical protein
LSSATGDLCFSNPPAGRNRLVPAGSGRLGQAGTHPHRLVPAGSGRLGHIVAKPRKGGSLTRDELLLAALAAGETTTAALVRLTGVTERSCRYGLSRLIAVGYAWSPQRGRWRLTEAGRAIASTLPSLSAAGGPDVESIGLRVAEDGTTTADETAELVPSREHPPGTPASLWWALAGTVAAIVLALARRSATSPPPPPSAPPTVWPYDQRRF